MDRELNPSSPTKSPAFTEKSLDLFALLADSLHYDNCNMRIHEVLKSCKEL